MRWISVAFPLVILMVGASARAQDEPPPPPSPPCTPDDYHCAGDIRISILHRMRVVVRIPTSDNAIRKYWDLAEPFIAIAREKKLAFAPTGDRSGFILSELPADDLSVITAIENQVQKSNGPSGVSSISTDDDDYFVISAELPKGRTDANTRVTVHVPDGSYHDLVSNKWVYTMAMPPLVQIAIEEDPIASGGASTTPACGERTITYPAHPSAADIQGVHTPCNYSFVLIRVSDAQRPATPPTENRQPAIRDVKPPVAETGASATKPKIEVIIGFEQTKNGLVVKQPLWHEIDAAAANTTTEYSVNGVPLIGREPLGKDTSDRKQPAAATPATPPPTGTATAANPGTSEKNDNTTKKPEFFFDASPDGWRVQATPVDLHACRRYPTADTPAFIDVPHPVLRYDLERGNGITVGAPKIYDTLALQRMLTDTASRLGGLSGFDSASIIGALGNIQGISRDTSTFSAQIAALPTASTVVNALTSTGGNNTTTASGAVPTTTNSTVTIQCPDGSLPTAGTAFGCTAPSSPPATALPGLTGQMTTTGTSTVGASTQQVNGTTTSQQSGTTTTSGGNSGLSYIPVAPTLNPLAVSNNVGLSSSDVLTQQVELNAQITSLRLLLQGALSDQFLVKDARAIANRQQTTLGFSVSLDPPKQYKHAVAEVRIVISPPAGQDGVSIMNLLPAEKTYNVAKVTSNAKQFGAGVMTSAIGIGANGGSSHDRLYLVKDTDTVALQFPRPGTPTLTRAFPRRVADTFHTALDFESRGACIDDDLAHLPPPGDVEEQEGGSIVFGWQFRPVLGQDYVASGLRQVFVQLALPATTDQQYIPSIHIQTRWRAYDPKSQVVGTIYKRTCSWTEGQGGIVLLSRPDIRDVRVADLGGGNVKISAHGDFFSSGVHIVAGAASYAPAYFDGSEVSFVGKASDFVGADEIKMVGANGQSGRFAIPVNQKNEEQCGISKATLVAMPNADGNSRMRLTLTMGARFGFGSRSLHPGVPLHDDPHPLVLIGNQVYGLRETPFFRTSAAGPCQIDQGGNDVCAYRFLAPTTDIRNAQRFTVSDIAWGDVRWSGKIEFLPALSAMAKAPWARKASATGGAADDGSKATDPNAPPPKPTAPVEYSISGFNLSALKPCHAGVPVKGDELCVKTTPAGIFEVNSDSVATLRLDPASKDISGVRFELSDGKPTDCHGSPDCTDWERRAVWDFKVPKDDSTPSLAAVQVHVGDSEQITFPGTETNLAGVASVSFEGAQLPYVYDPAKKSLSVNITSQVTRRAGHKDLIAIDPKQTKPIELPVDVL